MKTKTEKILNILLPIATVLFILLIWEIAALASGNEFLVPDVSAVASEFIKLFTIGEFYLSVLMTLVRSIIAFILSFLIAGALAVLVKRRKYADKIVQPIITITRALPTVAVVLLLVVWTTSFIAPIVVTMLVVLPTAYVNFSNALKSVDQKAIEMCKFYNVPQKKIFFKVELPQITPPLLFAMGSGLSLNLKLMVAAEVLAATAPSLGYMINIANYIPQVAKMMALVVVSVIFGIIIESVFSAFSKRAVKWK